MQNKVIIVLVAICCLTASCRNKVKNIITGWWTIDSLIYMNYDIRTCLLSNSFWFNKNGSIDLPIPKNYCSELVTEYNRKGMWSTLKTDKIPLLMRIESKNVIFRGTHQIIFRDDATNHLLKMEIKSDSLYVVCRKGLFDYDRNRDLVEYLVQLSYGRK